jgi:hypothetical protein
LGLRVECSMNSLAPVRFVGDWLLGIAWVVSEQRAESEQIHLRKMTAVISEIVVATAAIIWVMIYFVAGQDLLGLVPMLYTVFDCVEYWGLQAHREVSSI